MDNALTSQCILSGILAGNDMLARWTGGEWVCNRGNSEYFLVSGVGDQFLTGMPGWFVWPETKSKDDFEWVGTNYSDYVDDCPAERVFGLVRYDLGLLRSSKNISGLIEIKRHWSIEDGTPDLTKLARTLFYLGIKPRRLQNSVKEGVLVESVFFGAFVWHDPSDSTAHGPLEVQYHNIKSDIDTWWQGATTGGGKPIQEGFEEVYGFRPQPKMSYRSKMGTGDKGQWQAGAICLCLSLDEDR